jgi:hypothetical protein
MPWAVTLNRVAELRPWAASVKPCRKGPGTPELMLVREQRNESVSVRHFDLRQRVGIHHVIFANDVVHSQNVRRNRVDDGKAVAGQTVRLDEARATRRVPAGASPAAPDTYSMGVTLYYLLTGSYSLDFPSPVEIARKIAAGMTAWKALDLRNPDPRRLAELGFGHSLNIIVDPAVKPIPVRKRRPDLPPTLAEAVDHAVRKTESERFASATGMRDALLAAMA